MYFGALLSVRMLPIDNYLFSMQKVYLYAEMIGSAESGHISDCFNFGTLQKNRPVRSTIHTPGA